jgi:4,4'-diaponeurosporenoate glycosyltransferase
MYPSGFGALWQGFTKNLATGASKTPFWLFLLVVLLIASLSSAALHLILSLARGETRALLYGALYALWVVILFIVGRRIGRFSVFTAILYPVPLAVFLMIFVHSGILRLIGGTVKWKGRAVRPER